MADNRVNIQELIREMVEKARAGVTFSQRTYTDEPILQTGRQLQERKQRDRGPQRLGLQDREQWERDLQADRERRRDERARRTKARRAATAARFEILDRLDLKPAKPESDTQASTTHEVRSFINSTIPRIILPKRCKDMRELERGGATGALSNGSRASFALFWRQAKLMEDYEDDYVYEDSFSRYYPTYASMSDRELRGYFSWRTKLRHGQVEPAPLSFAFVHTYELLMGIGTTPGKQGYVDLANFAGRYQEVDPEHGERLRSYVRTWASDYAVLHGLDTSFARPAPGEEMRAAVCTLLRAEGCLLKQQGRERRTVWPGTETPETPPSAADTFDALCTLSRYHLGSSRLTKDLREDVSAVTCDVFARMVAHCSRRRKTDYVEGLFGYGVSQYWAPYTTAVYFDPDPHPDTTYTVSETERYVCRNGRWSHDLVNGTTDTNKDLGAVLHHVDFELRRQLDYRYPLKEKPVPKFVAKMVHDSVEEHLERKREEEARRITVDLSKLASIRAAAATTQEALLVDEERWEDVPAEPATVHTDIAPEVDHKPLVTASKDTSAADQPMPELPSFGGSEIPPSDSKTLVLHEEAPTGVPSTAVAGEESLPVGDGSVDTGTSLGLSPVELHVLLGLMDGKALSELLGPTDPLPSVVIDRINEVLFDELGDTAIDFDGVETEIVEDYVEDLKGLLGR